jgi:hypothetical protein
MPVSLLGVLVFLAAYASQTHAEVFDPAATGQLQGDWFMPETKGCYSSQPVIAIRGNEILLRSYQTEILVGTIKSVKSVDDNIVVGFRLWSAKHRNKLFEVRLRQDGESFLPLGATVDGSARPMNKEFEDFWSLTRCSEMSITRKILDYFFSSEKPYDPGPHVREVEKQ